MKRILIILIVIFSVYNISFSQKEKIKWHSISELDDLLKANPKPVFIDAFTDWCIWCKRLDQNTFSNPVIADILSNKYYAVKFNAEGKDPVKFHGQSFINDGKSGAAHQLAVILLKGQLSYPTVVFMDEKGQLLTPVAGYREPKEMEMILSYFADKAYEKQNFQEFQKTFKGKVR
jgi:thioredoxin-related protein